MDKPDLADAITYVVADQPNAGDRWHVLPDMTVIYERRPGEFEEARVLTASTLRDRPLWVELTTE
jgi:predicted Rdx family selenoprotein